MPVDFLPDGQASHHGRFAAEPTPDELEQFFCLNPTRTEGTTGEASAGEPARLRGAAGAAPGGNVRAFPTENLAPAVMVRFAAEHDRWLTVVHRARIRMRRGACVSRAHAVCALRLIGNAEWEGFIR